MSSVQDRLNAMKQGASTVGQRSVVDRLAAMKESNGQGTTQAAGIAAGIVANQAARQAVHGRAGAALGAVEREMREIEQADHTGKIGSSSITIASYETAKRRMEEEKQPDPELLRRYEALQTQRDGLRDAAYWEDRDQLAAALERAGRGSADFQDVVDRATSETWKSANVLMGNANARNVAVDIQLLARGETQRGTDEIDGAAKYMTPDQRDTFMYYAGTDQWDKATEYLDSIEHRLNAQQAHEIAESTREVSENNPLLGALTNIGAGFLTPLSWLDTAGHAVVSGITGEYTPTDPNSQMHIGPLLSQSSREGVMAAAEQMPLLGDIEIGGRNLGSEVAGVGLSIGQVASRLPFGGAGALALSAGSAAGEQSYNVLQRGGTQAEAAFSGLASGLIESATEKIGLDNLFSVFGRTGRQGVRQVLSDVARQAGIEATEEAISEVTNNLADIAIMGENSELNQYILQLEQQGMSPTQARNEAIKQFFLVNTAWSAAGGALSGGVMGGGASVLNGLTTRGVQQNTQTQQDAAQEPALWPGVVLPTADQNGMLPRAEIQTPDTEAQRLGQSAQGQNTAASTGEAGTLVERIRQSIPQIQNAQPVATIDGSEIPSGGKIVDRLVRFVNSIGNKVNRPGFGDVLFSKGRIKNSMIGHGIGNAKIETFAAVPAVIENGTQIDYQPNWKGRVYDTYTFAAPINYRGQTSYLGVVVTKDTQDGRYYVHEVVDGNGSVIYRGNENTEPTSDGRSGQQADLDTVVSSVSGNSIPQTGQNVNTQVNNSVTEGGVRGVPLGPESTGPDTSVGAAPANFTGDTVRGFSRNLATDLARNADIRQDYELDPDKYHRLSNNKTLKKARELYKSDFNGAADYVMKSIEAAELGNVLIPPEVIPLSKMVADTLAENGYLDDARYILSSIGAQLTAYGQTTQAARILRESDPLTKIQATEKLVDHMNQEFASDRGEVHDGKEGTRAADQWEYDVAGKLAKALASRYKGQEPQVKTLAETILSDLRHYANETAPKGKYERTSRTELDRISDLFENQNAYQEAWDAAKQKVSSMFENDANALKAFEKWLNSTLDYTQKLAKQVSNLDTVTLSKELSDQYLSAKTDQERDAIMDRIKQDIADQIPSNFLEKFNALRYLNMLGNLKTQIRNVGGNLIMRGVRFVRTKVQAAIEGAVRKASGGKFNRTTSFFRDRDIYKLAKADFENAKSDIIGEQKYSYNGRSIPADIQNRRTIFRNNGTWGTREESFAPARMLRRATDVLWRIPEEYRRLTNWAMETGDEIFAKSAYADALSRYLKANGATAEQYRSGTVDPDLMDRAISHAVREAQEATFRDKNAFSDMIAGIGFKHADNLFKKTANMAMQGMLPFRRTPANVAVRAEEYSPLGLINTAVQGVRMRSQNSKTKKGIKVKEGSKVTGADVINSLSKSLTGIGIFGVGAALGYGGMLMGMGSDDEDEVALDEQEGKQDYAIYLPDIWTEFLGLPKGFNLTLDWASPASIPMFMGAELGSAWADEGLSWYSLGEAVASSSNVLLNTSMLQSVNEQLSSISYSDNPLIDLVLNALTDYLTAGFSSTLSGQIERTAENQRMTTYVDENIDVPRDFQYTLGSQSARLPGFDFQQIPYVDEWGRTESTGNILERAINQFLNPSYTSYDTSNPVTEEIRRLYEETGDGAVVAQRADPELKINGEDVYLTSEQYVEYATTRGQTAYDIVSDMIENDLYRAMTDEQKADAIKRAYQYAGHVAAQAISPEHESDPYVAAARSADNAAEYLLLYEKYGSIGIKRYSDLMGAGLDAESAATVLDTVDSLTPAEGADSVTSLQRYRAIVDSGVSQEDQLAALSQYMSDSDYEKLSTGYGYGVTPDAYVTFRETLPSFDSNGNGSLTQAETEAALDALGGWLILPGSSALTNNQKAVLWQLQGKNWSWRNNPYNTAIGRQVYNALNSEESEDFAWMLNLPRA